ncbi:MAG: DivIVA domain-containing protein [Micrococcales bacterium]|nr:DivIVA domain-containing protein [Micrococcales bacterium]MCL2667375.1 DivIVA domain-containing protein [Micrococcales bacterium]
MALLTADDVLNKKFQSTKFREGYDQDEVDDFLDEVVATLREVHVGGGGGGGGDGAAVHALQVENDDLQARLAGAERRIAELESAVESAGQYQPLPPTEHLRGDDTTPESAQGLLAMAQKVHDDYVSSGKQEGDRVVSDARMRADQIISEAEESSKRTLGALEQERSLLERKIDELRVFERDYRTRLKSYLENLLGDLDSRGSALPAGSESRSL